MLVRPAEAMSIVTHRVLAAVNVYAWYALAPVAVCSGGSALGTPQLGIMPFLFKRPVWLPEEDIYSAPVVGADPTVAVMLTVIAAPAVTEKLNTCGDKPP